MRFPFNKPLLCTLLLAVYATAQECTLCADGSTPNILGSGNVAQCTALALAVGGLPPPPDPECINAQLAGFLRCGCPSPPTDVSSCSICGDPDVPFNEDKVFPGQDIPGLESALDLLPGGIETCADLNAIASIAGLTGNECTDFQAFGTYCECQGQEAICTLCPDGSAVPDAGLEILLPFNDEGLQESFSCGFLELGAAVVTEPNECPEFQLFAFACGCPDTEPACTICPLGEDPPLSGVDIADLGLTCEQADVMASTIVDDAVCSDFQQLGPIFCGCERETQGVCTSLCPNGEPTPLPGNPVAVNDGETVTCEEIELSYVPTIEDPEECEAVQAAAVIQCACEGTVSCPLCEDGSPLPDPLLSFGEGEDEDTCLGIAASFANEESDSGQCTAIQATGGHYCGCDNPLATQNVCRLCGDGVDLPDAGKIVSDPESGEVVLCGELEFEANSSNYTCDEARALFAPLCCDGTNPPNVTDVPIPTDPPNATDAPVPTDPPNATDAPVMTVPPNATDAPTTAPTDPAIVDPTDPPVPPCTSLCPNGEPTPLPDNIVAVNDGTPVTCGQLEQFISSIDPDDCEGVQAAAVIQCGCEGTISCPLCEDGSPLPDPLLTFGEGDAEGSCLAVAASFASEEQNSVRCTAIQATGGHYCGCVNPLATEDVCRLCGDGVDLTDAGKTVNDTDSGEAIACGQLEFEANSGNYTCEEARAVFSPLCCAATQLPTETDPPLTTDPPTPSPTEPVTVNPTPAPTDPPATEPPSTAPVVMNMATFLVLGLSMFVATLSTGV